MPPDQIRRTGTRRRCATSTTLTDLETWFRSLTSELGLRPVYHHKNNRISAPLFISELACHLVHMIRSQPKARGTHLSWEDIHRELDGQDRMTIELKRDDGRTIHFRKASCPEPRAQLIYDALAVSERPAQQQMTLVEISNPSPIFHRVVPQRPTVHPYISVSKNNFRTTCETLGLLGYETRCRCDLQQATERAKRELEAVRIIRPLCQATCRPDLEGL